jgi:hypothetical protein
VSTSIKQAIITSQNDVDINAKLRKPPKRRLHKKPGRKQLLRKGFEVS